MKNAKGGWFRAGTVEVKCVQDGTERKKNTFAFSVVLKKVHGTVSRKEGSEYPRVRDVESC